MKRKHNLVEENSKNIEPPLKKSNSHISILPFPKPNISQSILKVYSSNKEFELSKKIKENNFEKVFKEYDNVIKVLFKDGVVLSFKLSNEGNVTEYSCSKCSLDKMIFWCHHLMASLSYISNVCFE